MMQFDPFLGEEVVIPDDNMKRLDLDSSLKEFLKGYADIVQKTGYTLISTENKTKLLCAKRDDIKAPKAIIDLDRNTGCICATVFTQDCGNSDKYEDASNMNLTVSKCSEIQVIDKVGIGPAIKYLSKNPDKFEFSYNLFKARGAVQVGDTSNALGNCRTALLAILTTTDLSEFLKAIPKNSHTKSLWDMLSSAERVYSREDVEKLCDVLVYLIKIR